MIGWIMRAPRVINSKGELSGSWAFGQRGKMRQLLEAEGITFSDDERVDLKRYGWDPSRDLSAEELKRILDQAACFTRYANRRTPKRAHLDHAP
jgi:methylated-DNA-protein-cysteine methyltransferase-like protein